MEFEYDTALDRIDVAVRSVWKDAQKPRGLLGLDKEVVESLSGRPRPATERQVFALLRICPAVLSAALLVLAAYYRACGEGRTLFYERMALLWQA